MEVSSASIISTVFNASFPVCTFMNTLIWFVVLYWIISVGIGIYAARYVRNSKDYAIAGRSLPMSVVTATVFATWFGSEAVLGIPATFVKEGFTGVIADPFGSAMCLVLVGILFAKRLYRMNLMTISDYYRNRYGRTVEIIVSLCIVISYLGWVAAQIKALGLVFNVISGGIISMNMGMVIGSVSVLVYTLMGGMWSVAITDFLQMIIIVIGILYIGWEVSGMVGGADVVIRHAAEAGKLRIYPKPELRDILWFFGAWITLMFGSMPQQDVFQRVASSKNENVGQKRFGCRRYFLFAVRAGSDVFVLCRHAGGSFPGGTVYRSGFTDDPAGHDHDLYACFRTSHVFRCVAFGDQELRQRHIACAIRDFLGKRFEGNVSESVGQAIPVDDACRGACFCGNRHYLCHEYRFKHFRDGGKRLQDYAGGGVRSADIRIFLEICQ